MSVSKVWSVFRNQLLAVPVFPSALYPGDQVVEQKKDQDQPNGHIAKDAAVVSAGSNHGGETLYTAGQQACCAQEVRILKGRGKMTDCGGKLI